jgi:hypothetical protein
LSDLDRQLVRLLFVLTIGLLVFGMLDAHWTVREDTSFGLHDILHTLEDIAIGIFGVLAGKQMKGSS